MSRDVFAIIVKKNIRNNLPPRRDTFPRVIEDSRSGRCISGSVTSPRVSERRQFLRSRRERDRAMNHARWGKICGKTRPEEYSGIEWPDGRRLGKEIPLTNIPSRRRATVIPAREGEREGEGGVSCLARKICSRLLRNALADFIPPIVCLNEGLFADSDFPFRCFAWYNNNKNRRNNNNNNNNEREGESGSINTPSPPLPHWYSLNEVVCYLITRTGNADSEDACKTFHLSGAQWATFSGRKLTGNMDP